MIARILLVMAAFVGVGALSTACNDDGGGTLTLEEYFEKVDALDDAQLAESDRIEQELDALGEDATPDEVADSFQKQIDLLDDFREDLSDIEPPEEVEELHNTVVDGLDGATDQFGELVDALREADSVEEAFGAFQDSDFSEIDRVDEACRDLEQVATDNNITVDFDCGDEE